MTFKISVQPAGLDVRRCQRRSHPAGRHPLGCRPALRLPRWRLRVVQEPACRGPRATWRAPGQGPVGGRRTGRLDPDLLRDAANRLRGRGAHRGRCRRVPADEDAGAGGRAHARRARRGRDEAATASHRGLQVPRRTVRRIHPARRRPAQLLDRHRARADWATRPPSSCTCATCPAASSPTMSSAR